MVTEEELKNMSHEEIKKLQEQNCIFCKIGKKEIPAKILYEDDLVIAFLDIQPLTFGHTILTTKKHYVFFSQVPDDETGHLFKVAQQLSQSMLKALQVKGTNIFIANGEIAGQQAPHFMMHIIPRKENSDIPQFHPTKVKYSLHDLDKIQHALVNRVSDVFKVDMQAKLTSVSQDSKEERTELPQKHVEEKPETQEKTTEQENKTDQETKQEKSQKEDNHNNDVDLDKISNLFK